MENFGNISCDDRLVKLEQKKKDWNVFSKL